MFVDVVEVGEGTEGIATLLLLLLLFNSSCEFCGKYVPAARTTILKVD